MDLRCRTGTILVLLLVSYSHTQALDTATMSINKLDIYSQQKPCAQHCFWNACGDALGAPLGCLDWSCGGVSPNYCYCRPDGQSAAESYLTSCFKSACTAGDSSIDISSAGSIYNYYCSSKGYIVAAAAPTTTQEVAPATTTTSQVPQATTTVYVTIYRSEGTSNGVMNDSTLMEIWRLTFLLVAIDRSKLMPLTSAQYSLI